MQTHTSWPMSSSSAASGSSSAQHNSAPLDPTGEKQPAAKTKKPTACIVIGMAGSGKTTLMQRLNADLHEARLPYYLINLDPAVLETPFGANIDIRDTVNYKEVMKQYKLGPNGGILTALNLFATRFEQAPFALPRYSDRRRHPSSPCPTMCRGGRSSRPA